MFNYTICLLSVFLHKLATMNSPIDFELALITVCPHSPNEGYSAFIAQFPEAIAYGETEEEAQENLKQIFKVMMQDKEQEARNHYLKNQHFTSTSFKMTNVA